MAETGSLVSKAEMFLSTQSTGKARLEINNDLIVKCQEGDGLGACLEDV